ncbi:class I SAM-dependent methyltransferase [bacterium]|nr:class I SAM-dependent methyltransferase [bacterium]
MFEYEDHYWWYRALHELIEFFVQKEQKRGKRFLNILDAGCGTGKLLTILKKYGNTHGIDYSEDAIMYCKKRGLKNIKIGDLCHYQSNPSLYDIITHIDILCCVKKENEIRIIKEFHNALKPDGILILNLPAFHCLRRRHDIAVGSYRRYRRNRFIPKLIDIGFHIEIQSYRLPVLFIPILLKKYFETINKRKEIRSDFSPLPFFINWSLLQMFRIENKIIDKINIPFGTSLFIVARKR